MSRQKVQASCVRTNSYLLPTARAQRNAGIVVRRGHEQTILNNFTLGATRALMGIKFDVEESSLLLLQQLLHYRATL